MYHFRKVYNKSILLPIDLYIIHKYQIESNKAQENTIEKEFKNITLYIKENTNQIIIPVSL